MKPTINYKAWLKTEVILGYNPEKVLMDINSRMQLDNLKSMNMDKYMSDTIYGLDISAVAISELNYYNNILRMYPICLINSNLSVNDLIETKMNKQFESEHCIIPVIMNIPCFDLDASSERYGTEIVDLINGKRKKLFFGDSCAHKYYNINKRFREFEVTNNTIVYNPKIVWLGIPNQQRSVMEPFLNDLFNGMKLNITFKKYFKKEASTENINKYLINYRAKLLFSEDYNFRFLRKNLMISFMSAFSKEFSNFLYYNNGVHFLTSRELQSKDEFCYEECIMLDNCLGLSGEDIYQNPDVNSYGGSFSCTSRMYYTNFILQQIYSLENEYELDYLLILYTWESHNFYCFLQDNLSKHLQGKLVFMSEQDHKPLFRPFFKKEMLKKKKVGIFLDVINSGKTLMNIKKELKSICTIKFIHTIICKPTFLNDEFYKKNYKALNLINLFERNSLLDETNKLINSNQNIIKYYFQSFKNWEYLFNIVEVTDGYTKLLIQGKKMIFTYKMILKSNFYDKFIELFPKSRSKKIYVFYNKEVIKCDLENKASKVKYIGVDKIDESYCKTLMLQMKYLVFIGFTEKIIFKDYKDGYIVLLSILNDSEKGKNFCLDNDISSSPKAYLSDSTYEFYYKESWDNDVC